MDLRSFKCLKTLRMEGANWDCFIAGKIYRGRGDGYELCIINERRDLHYVNSRGENWLGAFVEVTKNKTLKQYFGMKVE